MTRQKLKYRTPTQFLQDVGDRLCAKDELGTDPIIQDTIDTLCQVWCDECERAQYFGGRGWIEADGTIIRHQS